MVFNSNLCALLKSLPITLFSTFNSSSEAISLWEKTGDSTISGNVRATSTVRNQPYKWVHMINNLDANEDGSNSPEEIYNWFTNDGTETDDVTLVNNFRTAMIDYN